MTSASALTFFLRADFDSAGGGVLALSGASVAIAAIVYALGYLDGKVVIGSFI